MSSLRQLQEAFQAHVLCGRGGIEAEIAGTASVGPIERLRIYADAYRLRLLEALGTDYSGLKRLLGEDAFDRLGRAYIDAHPSDRRSIRWFGRHMAHFLANTGPYLNDPVLAEMAAFEWAQGEAFDAADDPSLTIEQMAALPPEAWPTLRFQPHASIRRLWLGWNVPAMWQAFDQGRRDVPPAEPVTPPLRWLVWRNERMVHWRSLAEDETAGFDHVVDECTFGEVCEVLCRWHDPAEVSLRAAAMLKTWIAAGLLARVILE